MHTRINEVVKQSGLSKTDFAKRLGVSQPFVSKLCTGDAAPSDRTIQDICRIFCVNKDWLLTGEGEPFTEKTREEEIMGFAVDTLRGSDEFRKAMVSMFAKLEPEDWVNLEKIYRKLAEEYKKSDHASKGEQAC